MIFSFYPPWFWFKYLMVSDFIALFEMLVKKIVKRKSGTKLTWNG